MQSVNSSISSTSLDLTPIDISESASGSAAKKAKLSDVLAFSNSCSSRENPIKNLELGNLSEAATQLKISQEISTEILNQAKVFFPLLDDQQITLLLKEKQANNPKKSIEEIFGNLKKEYEDLIFQLSEYKNSATETNTAVVIKQIENIVKAWQGGSEIKFNFFSAALESILFRFNFNHIKCFKLTLNNNFLPSAEFLNEKFSNLTELEIKRKPQVNEYNSRDLKKFFKLNALKIEAMARNTTEYATKTVEGENLILLLNKLNLKKVTCLNLEGNFFKQLKLSNSTFPSLKKLYLTNCGVYGFSKTLFLPHLEELECDQGLIGHFDCSVNNFPELKCLSLADSLIKKQYALLNFPSLKELDLSRISYTENFFDFSNLNNLKKLYLSHCEMRSLPKSIGKLKNLEDLNLYGNFFFFIEQETYFPPHLKKICLEDCQLTDIPSKLVNCEKIEELNFSRNIALSSHHLSQFNFTRLKNLKEVDISACNLSVIPLNLITHPTIELLNLESNFFSLLPLTIFDIEREILLKISTNFFSEEQEENVKKLKLNVKKNKVYIEGDPTDLYRLDYVRPWVETQWTPDEIIKWDKSLTDVAHIEYLFVFLKQVEDDAAVYFEMPDESMYLEEITDYESSACSEQLNKLIKKLNDIIHIKFNYKNLKKMMPLLLKALAIDKNLQTTLIETIYSFANIELSDVTETDFSDPNIKFYQEIALSILSKLFKKTYLYYKLKDLNLLVDSKERERKLKEIDEKCLGELDDLYMIRTSMQDQVYLEKIEEITSDRLEQIERLKETSNSEFDSINNELTQPILNEDSRYDLMINYLEEATSSA